MPSLPPVVAMDLTINVNLARDVMILMRVVHYKGHWKGWALKSETFLGPGHRAKLVPYGPKKVENFSAPLPMARMGIGQQCLPTLHPLSSQDGQKCLPTPVYLPIPATPSPARMGRNVYLLPSTFLFPPPPLQPGWQKCLPTPVYLPIPATHCKKCRRTFFCIPY